MRCGEILDENFQPLPVPVFSSDEVGNEFSVVGGVATVAACALFTWVLNEARDAIPIQSLKTLLEFQGAFRDYREVAAALTASAQFAVGGSVFRGLDDFLLSWLNSTSCVEKAYGSVRRWGEGTFAFPQDEPLDKY